MAQVAVAGSAVGGLRLQEALNLFYSLHLLGLSFDSCLLKFFVDLRKLILDDTLELGSAKHQEMALLLGDCVGLTISLEKYISLSDVAKVVELLNFYHVVTEIDFLAIHYNYYRLAVQPLIFRGLVQEILATLARHYLSDRFEQVLAVVIKLQQYRDCAFSDEDDF